MRKVSVICKCQNLVDVVDKRIAEHMTSAGGRCEMSGTRYVSPRGGGGERELVAAVEVGCSCGEPLGFGLLFRQTHQPRPSEKEYPTFSGPVSGVVN